MALECEERIFNDIDTRDNDILLVQSFQSKLLPLIHLKRRVNYVLCLSVQRAAFGLLQFFGWRRHMLCVALCSLGGTISHTGTSCGGISSHGDTPFIYMIFMWHAASKTRPSTHVRSSHANTGIGAFHALLPTSS